MKKQHLAATIAGTLALTAASTCFAAANPFSDVPKDHWAYDAVAQLAKAGVIEGYGDTTFQGDKSITRYEMAQMVARAMAKKDVSATDKAAIDKLAAEFGDELNSLGVRVANLEKHSDNVKWSGSFTQKYMRYDHKSVWDGSGNEQHDSKSPWWEKEFDLNATADVPGSGFKVNASFVTKWGAGYADGPGFNVESDHPDAWNGGNTKSNENRLDKVYVEGNLGKTGQYLKFGEFQPWTLNGFICDANIKGASLEHWGSKLNTHIFGGRLDVKDGDMATNGVWTSDGTSTGGSWSDNVRYHDNSKANNHDHGNGNWGYDDKWSGGNDNYVDWTNGWAVKSTRKDIFAAALDYTFNKRFNTSLGYYRYRSAAYDHNWLNIGAAVVNYKLARNLNLEGMYAHGDQDGHNDAWNIELQFRGNPWIPADRPHLFGAYLGYRYLGPDALVKTNFGDGAKAGQRGWEIGCFYNLSKNIQYSLKYFMGKSITNNSKHTGNPDERTGVFTSLSFNF